MAEGRLPGQFACSSGHSFEANILVLQRANAACFAQRRHATAPCDLVRRQLLSVADADFQRRAQDSIDRHTRIRL